MSASLKSVDYTRGTMSVLDQLLIPHEKTYVPILSTQDAWSVIRQMQVRGAPLIAIVAALGLAIDVFTKHNEGAFKDGPNSAGSFLLESMQYLRTSRPTAVNLFVATDELTALVNKLLKTSGITAEAIVMKYIEAAEQMLEDDVNTNKAIGDYGAKRILELSDRKSIRVMTICNTGSLATAGYGTALGVVRSLHAMGALEHVYACETRPYNQGARLTAFEIVEDGLPGTLITDSMASALMATKGVDCVVVGADRVTANGDTANKIGTYQLAIAAAYHGIPFFAAVPTTTLDLTMSSGSEITIEERPADELCTIFGKRIAPEGISVWNPAFDVTPCHLIKGIITERGIAEAAKDCMDKASEVADLTIDIPGFLRSKGGLEERCKEAVDVMNAVSAPASFKVMDAPLLMEYILTMSNLCQLLDISSDVKSVDQCKGIIDVKEVGDGNLNFVYIVTGPTGKKLVAKQALPYIRCVGEGWPLTLERASFETHALIEQRRLCPEYVPEVYHFNPKLALIFMRFVEEPHLILRKFFVDAIKVESFSEQLSTFMANILFGTSAVAMDGGSFRSRVAQWSRNVQLCALTEGVVFTDPYMVHSNNRWNAPYLDSDAQQIRENQPLKLAAAAMKEKFLSKTQALIHGDLHSGSVMAKEGSTYVIDPEFAFYGPIGFDVGAIIANLFLAYASQNKSDDNKEYGTWLLRQIEQLWSSFEAKFIALWDAKCSQEGNVSEMFRSGVFSFPSDVKVAQKQFMEALWVDTLGFAGCKMIRRVVGIAHVEDLEAIEDLKARAVCEKMGLQIGQALLLHSTKAYSDLGDMQDVYKLTAHVAKLNEVSVPKFRATVNSM